MKERITESELLKAILNETVTIEEAKLVWEQENLTQVQEASEKEFSHFGAFKTFVDQNNLTMEDEGPFTIGKNTYRPNPRGKWKTNYGTYDTVGDAYKAFKKSTD